MNDDNFPFADCAEEFGNTTMNLYYSSPSTLAAVSSLLFQTRGALIHSDTPEPNTEDIQFMDLGCGDGRIVIHMAKAHGIRSTGIDFSPASIAEATENARLEGVSHLCTFMTEDIMAWESIPNKYTWISAYLPKVVVNRLKGLLERWILAGDVGAGSDPKLFVSILYEMKGWDHEKLAGRDENMTLWVADRSTVMSSMTAGR